MKFFEIFFFTGEIPDLAIFRERPGVGGAGVGGAGVGASISFPQISHISGNTGPIPKTNGSTLI